MTMVFGLTLFFIVIVIGFALYTGCLAYEALVDELGWTAQRFLGLAWLLLELLIVCLVAGAVFT